MSEKKKVPARFVVAAGQAPPTAEEVIAFFKSANFEADTTYLATDPTHSGFISVTEHKYDPATFVVAAGQAPPTAEEVIAFSKSANFEADTTYLATDPTHSGFISVTEHEYEYDPED